MTTRNSGPTMLEGAAGNYDAELERLASRIADGVPLGPDDGVTPPGGRGANAGLRLIEKVAQEFRRSSQATPAPAGTVSLFRFAGLDALAQIGAGSYGEIYRAYDPALDHYVALKLRRGDSELPAEALLDEARRLARLQHPNIVRIHGAAVDGGRAGLWTELVRGTTLEQILAGGATLSAAEITQIGREMCHALACIHRHGLVHGDVKPANIMRDDYGRVVLMDFGAARALVATPSDELSQGSIRYLPLEVLRGEQPTPQADVYALGVTLFRLAAGRPPYDADDLSGLMRALERGERLDLRKLRPDLPAALCAAIDSALASDPQKRHHSALAFAAALDAGSTHAAVNRRWMIGAVAAAVAVVVAAFALSRPPAWVATAALYRENAAGYRALNDGDSLAVGDAFALEFQSTRPAWLYVIDDDGNEPVVLFPSADLAAANPLEPSAAWRLPGASKRGGTADWSVDRDALREQITVVAAAAPIAALEAAIADLRHAEEAADPVGLRGASSLVPAPRGSFVAPAVVREAIADFDERRARGELRVWQFTFPHRDHGAGD